MNAQKPETKIGKYLEGISKYLTSYRAREGLTQSEMAQRLGLSLNRYREYEQNTTDNSKGIALDLLLKITDLEGIPAPEFIAKLDESAPRQSELDELESALLSEFRDVPLEDRRTFVRLLKDDGNSGSDEPLIPQKMRWLVRLNNFLAQLPYDMRMKFEREVLEEYMAVRKPAPDSAEHELLMERLRELIRHYFTNFESYRK